MRTNFSCEGRGPLDTAVLFLVFNRPGATDQVFEAIRKAQPSRLYIAADGARPNVPGEKGECDTVRLVATRIDWPCEVKTLFRDENLGCKNAVNSALDWFFTHEEQGIVLEDDCLPALGFFWFCQELLNKYRHDDRVWQISGTAFVPESARSEQSTSYVFSKYGPIWGWASWRRAWIQNDRDLKQWPEMRKENWLYSAYHSENERKARLILGDRLFQNEIDTWDYQWGFTKNFQSGLSIIPSRNMVVNIGFGPQATHTFGRNPLAPMKSWDVQLPLVHPLFILADFRHDQIYQKKIGIGSTEGIAKKVLNRVMRLRNKGRAFLND